MPPTYLQNSRVFLLVGIVVATMLVWGIVLPSIAARPDFTAARQRFEDCGIDASAFFYTDHPRTFKTGFGAGKVSVESGSTRAISQSVAVDSKGSSSTLDN